MSWSDLTTPYGLILGSLLVGLVFERIVLVRLRDLAARTRAESDDVVSFGLRGAVVLWFVLLGIYAALQSVELGEPAEEFTVHFLRINLIISFTWVVMKIAVRLIMLYFRRNDILASTTIFTNLTRIVIGAIGGLIMLQALGVPITPMLTTLGVGGLAVALALQDTLANIFAGIYIIASKKIRLGDQVKLASGEEGAVRDINWRNTTIQGPTGHLIIVPNSTMASAVVTNYNLPSTETAVAVALGVSYHSDLDQVERVALEVAREVMREVEGGMPEFEPSVRFSSFGDLRVGFSVVMRAQKFGDQFLIRHEFFKRIHRRFREEGIEFDAPLALRDLGGDQPK